ncbi:hypothetical protein LEP1GSC108_4705 [Leptospira weilii str. UI 13098]|uniref:Uncharacterized protein n=1 Tax=Leptospira weilii str. UI 13098 TaxID=1088542 RepID=M6Q3U0_9LEPT|nr:hypothetical protein LEP1GSC108_4705 [Leptospira weilii str. UI 13098]
MNGISKPRLILAGEIKGRSLSIHEKIETLNFLSLQPKVQIGTSAKFRIPEETSACWAKAQVNTKFCSVICSAKLLASLTRFSFSHS